MLKKIAFNIPFTSIRSIENIQDIVENPDKIIQKFYTKACEKLIEQEYPEYHALMTPSGTKAIELAAVSMGLKPDDEIIMSSYNFVGVANAFASTGAKIVFADLDAATMNISLESIKKSLTLKTKAVVAMNYAGYSDNLLDIKNFCFENRLILIEDNAQGIGSEMNEKPLGSFGDFSIISFDHMKNISCSEGGVLLFKTSFLKSVLSVFHNGTNRADFDSGKISSFEWKTKGSKYSMSEYTAAALLPLLEEKKFIIKQRLVVWNKLYFELKKMGIAHIQLPDYLFNSGHNGHIFYIKCLNTRVRSQLIEFLKNKEIPSHPHYPALHESEYAKSRGFILKDRNLTSAESSRLLRLPMHNYLKEEQIQYIAEAICSYYQ